MTQPRLQNGKVQSKHNYILLAMSGRIT